MIFEQGDVIVAPFPFINVPVLKPRPSVILSKAGFNERQRMIIIAMITTASQGRWVDDHEIVDLPAAGLRHPSFIRWKIHMLPLSIAPRRIGKLGARDRAGLKVRASSVLW